MKLVKYVYKDGEVTPKGIINGGYFYHIGEDGSVFLVGVAEDDYPSPALTREELEQIAVNFTKDEYGREVFTPQQIVDNFLQMLNEIYKYNIKL